MNQKRPPIKRIAGRQRETTQALTEKGLNAPDAQLVVRKLRTRGTGPQRALVFLIQHATQPEIEQIAKRARELQKQPSSPGQPHPSLASIVHRFAIAKISQEQAQHPGRFYQALQRRITTHYRFADILPEVADKARNIHEPARRQEFLQIEQEILRFEKNGLLLTPEGIIAQQRFWTFIDQTIKE